MPNRFLRESFLLALSLAGASAAVRLPQMLSSHAVLQRDQPVRVWGWADSGETVTVAFAGQTQTGTPDRLGHWSVFFPPHAAGGPFEMTVKGTNEIHLQDLLLGDVWFASGQSNMEMPLRGFPGNATIKDASQEIGASNNPNIRLLLIPKRSSPFPLAEFADKITWTTCTPETAAEFSAVAYFFGRDLAAQEHVAIGLIDSTWGGTPAEAWTSMDGLSSEASLMPMFAAFSKMSNGQAGLEELKRADQREDEAARKANLPVKNHPWRGDLSSWTPSWLYNGMVSPAIQYGIKGAIWYQGESNTDATRAPLYEKLFTTMISDWRAHWSEGDFPFLFVQLANFGKSPGALWPELREAQRQTLKLVNTGMAVTIDVGESDNIHPADKQAVGARLARAARALAYRKPIFYTGPLFEKATTEGSGLRVWFKGADGVLSAKGGALKGFEVAGEDGNFSGAEATIEGSTVMVKSPSLDRPKYVRYGWQNDPVLNLFDSAGLPASPFTSQRWGPTE